MEKEKKEGEWELTKEQVVEVKDKLSRNINFEVETKQLLCRKADIICRCYRKT